MNPCAKSPRDALTASIVERLRPIKPSPGEVPRLDEIEVAGITLPRADGVGGDHIIYIDFNRRYNLDALQREKEDWWQKEAGRTDLAREERAGLDAFLAHRRDQWRQRLETNRRKAGVLVADVRGHDISDAFVVGMLHQAFLTGALYELKIFGEITPNLFEIINTRFFNSSSIGDFLTMIYGEIYADGTFRFISAGHPPPIIFSRLYGRFMDIPQSAIRTYPPIGLMPRREEVDIQAAASPLGFKDGYRISELRLMAPGDLLLLYTDGLTDLSDAQGKAIFPAAFTDMLKAMPDATADTIAVALREWIRRESGTQQDDISFVVIRRR